MPSQENTADNRLHQQEYYKNMEYPINIYRITMTQMYMEYVRWHWHEELEFDIILDGTAELYIGNEHILLSKGQGVMINQNVLHSLHAVSSASECTMQSILVNPSYLFGYDNVLLSIKYQLPVLDAPSCRYLLLQEKVTKQHTILKQLQKIYTLNSEKEYGYELLTKSELCLLWMNLLENITPSPTDSEETITVSNDEMRIKTIMEYIADNYMQSISLEDIASSVHLSKSECCRCFKRTLNLTPFEYLMKYRIFTSAQKIQKKDADASSISSLAASVGFNNTSYFNKLFKKYIHCTPNSYKKSVAVHSDLALDALGEPTHF